MQNLKKKYLISHEYAWDIQIWQQLAFVFKMATFGIGIYTAYEVHIANTEASRKGHNVLYIKWKKYYGGLNTTGCSHNFQRAGKYAFLSMDISHIEFTQQRDIFTQK